MVSGCKFPHCRTNFFLKPSFPFWQICILLQNLKSFNVYRQKYIDFCNFSCPHFYHRQLQNVHRSKLSTLARLQRGGRQKLALFDTNFIKILFSIRHWSELHLFHDMTWFGDNLYPNSVLHLDTMKLVFISLSPPCVDNL